MSSLKSNLDVFHISDKINKVQDQHAVSTIGITIYPTKQIKRCIHNTVLEIHRYPLWTVFDITGTFIHLHYKNLTIHWLYPVITLPVPLKVFMWETAILRMVSLSGFLASVLQVGTMSQSSLMYEVILFLLLLSISQ